MFSFLQTPHYKTQSYVTACLLVFGSVLIWLEKQGFYSIYFNHLSVIWSIMAAMLRSPCAFPRLNTRPTCMESALIISPRSRFPISIASLDLPVPVAPKITTKDGAIALRKAHCTLRVDAAMMLTPRRPADTRAHAQHVERREGGLCYHATDSRYCGNTD